MTVAGWHVLLGGDYCGKSSLVRHLGARPGMGTASLDAAHLSDAPAIHALRVALLQRILPAPENHPGLVASHLQTMIHHLRDVALAKLRSGPVVIDAYYYKLLAKCRLKGLIDDATMTAWRALPQPARVTYLAVEPDVLWQRSGGAAALNAFEHYGRVPTRDGFLAFQRDLHDAMVSEVRGLHVETLDGTQPTARLARILARSDGLRSVAVAS